MRTTQAIQASKASINKISVEIRQIFVSNRQMTMSVFRQIKKEDILVNEDDFSLKGKVWGHVNYYPEPVDPSYWLNILWEKDGELNL